MQRLDFINTESIEKLFGTEMELLQQAIQMSHGGDVFFIEFSHKEVFRWVSFLLGYNLANKEVDLQEILLKKGIPFPEFKQKEGYLFLYAFIESPTIPLPIDIDENLIKRLNQARETIAHSKTNLILWIYHKHVPNFQRVATDLWVVKRGLYGFILPTNQSITSLPISSEISTVEAVELIWRAIRLETEIESSCLSTEHCANLHEQAAVLWERVALTRRAHYHNQKLKKILLKVNNFQNLQDIYLQRLAQKLEWLDFKGIRQLKIIIKFRLTDLFVAPFLKK